MKMNDFQIAGVLRGSIMRVSGEHVVCIETNMFGMQLLLTNGGKIHLNIQENLADIRAVEEALRKHK